MDTLQLGPSSAFALRLHYLHHNDESEYSKAMKLIFSSKSVKTYIFVYWIVRSLILYASSHVFHSILVLHSINATRNF